ncbi:endonuclease III [groundwater metagenome]
MDEKIVDKKISEIIELLRKEKPDVGIALTRSTPLELLTLQGVARKTANIVLSGAFGKLEGIAVDTHVKRLSFLIHHGRKVCTARKPLCSDCILNMLCPPAFTFG